MPSDEHTSFTEPVIRLSRVSGFLAYQSLAISLLIKINGPLRHLVRFVRLAPTNYISSCGTWLTPLRRAIKLVVKQNEQVADKKERFTCLIGTTCQFSLHSISQPLGNYEQCNAREPFFWLWDTFRPGTIHEGEDCLEKIVEIMRARREP